MQNLMLDHDPTPLRPPRQLLPPLSPLAPDPSAYLLGTAADRPPWTVRPALLAGEDLDAPDQHIFRGTD
ncbi:hypothetical protein [Streptomyces microflavus]|uniref:hypothetical protein n=1 Tax=Streptomyces microflavus TaxID=1919 RepID=UPI0036EE9BF5